MKPTLTKSKDKDIYFAELHPIIRNRLMTITFIIIAAYLSGKITNFFVLLIFTSNQSSEVLQTIHWMNFLVMLFTFFGLSYSAYKLKKMKYVSRSIYS